MAVRTNRVPGEVVEAADLNAIAQLANSNEARVNGALAIADADATVARYIDDPASATAKAVVGEQQLLATLPDRLNNTWRYQQSSYSQDNIVTLSDGTQYAVWINDAVHPIVGKRMAGSAAWETYDLRNIPGDPFGVQAEDGHNTFVLGVDPTGTLHVSGNMHGDPLRYAQTTTPGDISAWTMPGMVGTQESAVSYPQFFNAANGDLFFAYRDGGTESGDMILNRRVGSAWQRVAKLIDGQSVSMNPYFNRIAVGPDGSIHVFFTWRETGEAESNADICYLRSSPDGSTWFTSSGAAQVIPATRANSEVAVNVEHQSGLINQSGADVDADGNPHGVFTLYDADGNTQYHHVWHDGSTWHNDQVTHFTTRVETLAPLSTLDLTTARPQIICTNEGDLFILGMTQGDGWGGAALIIDAASGATARLFDMDLARWEPAYDQRALKERGELNMLVTALMSPAPSTSPWGSMWGGILSVPTKMLRRLVSGAIQPLTETDADRGAGDLSAGETVGRKVDRGDLPSGTDLNDINQPRQTGIYFMPGPGRSYTNLPDGIKMSTDNATAQNAWLRVDFLAPELTIQTAFSEDGGYVGQRTRMGATWTEWRQVAGNNGLVLATSGVDLFALPNGHFQLQSAGTYTNEPAAFASLGVAGTLDVVGYGTTIRTARLITLDRTKAWETWSVNGSWNPWVQVRGT